MIRRDVSPRISSVWRWLAYALTITKIRLTAMVFAQRDIFSHTRRRDNFLKTNERRRIYRGVPRCDGDDGDKIFVLPSWREP